MIEGLPPELEWPPHMLIARGELGQKEFDGPDSNPRILAYYRATRIGSKVEDSATAWCAAFVCWVLHRAGIRSTQSAAARSFMGWGETLETPRFGAIAVLWRDAPDTSKGHVGFYCHHDDNGRVILLGGNQNNQVGYGRYSPSRVLSYRWPKPSDRFDD